MMDRLTERLPNGVIKRSAVMGDTAMSRLAAYEDTGLTPEAVALMVVDGNAGRLVNLPCRPGDTLYAIIEDYCDPRKRYISPWECRCVMVNGGGRFSVMDEDGNIDDVGTQFAYLTESDARAALEKEDVPNDADQ